jgi:predicted  nucleic acid-binding Zn-ribbon protein
VENLREQISRIEEDLEQAEAKKVDFQQQTEDNEKNYEEARRLLQKFKVSEVSTSGQKDSLESQIERKEEMVSELEEENKKVKR